MADLTDLMAAAERHLYYGVEAGGFTTAVLENYLFRAMGSSDPTSHMHIYQLCMFIANCFPRESYGDRERVSAWQKMRGVTGIYWPPEETRKLVMMVESYKAVQGIL